MSKSLGNVVDPLEVSRAFGNDALRYFLMREMHFGEDGDFSLERLKGKYVHELSNELGNLVYRVLSMTEKYCDGIVPEYGAQPFAIDWNRYCTALESFKLHEAIALLLEVIRSANKYIDDVKPWMLAKTDMAGVANTMGILLETLRQIAHLALPYIPDTAVKIITQLGLDTEKECARDFEERTVWGGLSAGTHIAKGELLFPRLEG